MEESAVGCGHLCCRPCCASCRLDHMVPWCLRAMVSELGAGSGIHRCMFAGRRNDCRPRHACSAGIDRCGLQPRRWSSRGNGDRATRDGCGRKPVPHRLRCWDRRHQREQRRWRPGGVGHEVCSLATLLAVAVATGRADDSLACSPRVQRWFLCRPTIAMRNFDGFDEERGRR